VAPARPGRRLAGWGQSRAGLVVLALVLVGTYGAWFKVSQQAPLDLAHIGRRFASQSQASPLLRADGRYSYPAGATGYDGQFFYDIAVDPANARYYMDDPGYRYNRILYPAVARALALGHASAVPVALLAVNLGALGVAVVSIGLWLRRRGLSPLLAAVFGLAPGIFWCISLDLADNLGFALFALGLVLLDLVGWTGVVAAGLAFGLAGLARESTALFAVVWAVALATGRAGRTGGDQVRADGGPWGTRRSWLQAMVLVVLAVLPIVAWEMVVRMLIGRMTTPAAEFLELRPFGGILHYLPFHGETADVVRSIVLPGILCGGVAAWALARRLWYPEVVSLAISSVLFVVFLNRSAYEIMASASRIHLAVILFATCCLPRLQRAGLGRAWYWASAALWTSTTPFLLIVPLLQSVIRHVRPG
jgi:hypothetical protein